MYSEVKKTNLSLTEALENHLNAKGQNLEDFDFVFFGKADLEHLMVNPECAGIRFRIGHLPNDNAKTLIAISVKSDGSEISESGATEAGPTVMSLMPCPRWCQ